MKRTTKMKGFTLIELVIVITILAILAAIGLQLFNGVYDNEKLTVAEANARTLADCINTYIALYRPVTGAADPATIVSDAVFYGMYSATPNASGANVWAANAGVETFGVLPPFYSNLTDETNARLNITFTTPSTGSGYPICAPLDTASIKAGGNY